MNRPEIRAGLDTSVLVRLLRGQPADQANTAFEFLAEAEEAGEGILVSNLVVAEAHFACQRHYRLPKADVESQADEITITRKGRPVAVLVSYDDFES